MRSVWSEVRTAARMLRAAPGQFAAPVVALGLGVAAAITLYTAFQVVADDLPPIPQPERVARLYLADPSAPMGRRMVRAGDLQRVLDRAAGNFTVATAVRRTATVEIGNCARSTTRSTVWRVSASFPDVIQVAPQFGRTWSAANVTEPAALLSAGFWRRACGADPQIVGRTVRVDSGMFDVIGVMPDGFWMTDRETDVWLLAPHVLAEGGDVLARLNGTETWSSVNARLAAGLAADCLVAVPLTDPSVRRGAQALIGLLGPALLVLLVACGNASAVLVGRALGRERELAIRLSLGATPWRVARQALTESAVVAGAAGVVALPIAAGAVRVLRAALSPLSAGAARLIVLDTRAMVFALGTVAVTVGLTGMLPALRAARADIASMLPNAPRGTIWRPGAYSVGDLLLLVQMALAVVLVAVTLLFRSVLGEVAGSQPQGSLDQIGVWRVVAATTSDVESDTARRVLDAAHDLPGVDEAGLTDTRPLPGGQRTTFATDSADGTGTCRAVLRVVTPGYFHVLGLTAEAGQLFATSARDVAVASATLAERCWGTAAIVGRQVSLTIGSVSRSLEIAGVVSDAAGQTKIPELQPADLYLPASAIALGSSAFVVLRQLPGVASTDADARELVQRASSGALVLEEAATLKQMADQRTNAPRTLVGVFGALALLAMVLATTGVYASVNQSVVRRRRSFAIRLALGAGPGSLASLAVARDAVLVTAGACAGMIGTLAVTEAVWPDALVLAGTDPRFWLMVCGALVASGVLASIGPVWQTLHLTPMSILNRD